MTLTLPIQTGKKYVRRDGKVVEARVMDLTPKVAQPFVDGCVLEHEAVWTRTGRFSNGEDAPYDLVADYIEASDIVASPQGHPHAALMLEYARDWAETPCPWERWEFLEGGTGAWLDIIGDHPSWDRDNVYRRKPRTVNINGHKVPDPLRVAPEMDTTVWQVDLQIEGGAESDVWMGTVADRLRLSRGVLHTTQEAAAAHARALLSFTTSV